MSHVVLLRKKDKTAPCYINAFEANPGLAPGVGWQSGTGALGGRGFAEDLSLSSANGEHDAK